MKCDEVAAPCCPEEDERGADPKPLDGAETES